MLSSLSRRRVVVLLILTSLLLITLDRRSNNAIIDKARQAFAVVLRPFDVAADAVSKPIANAWYGITHYDDVKDENEALRDQLENQKGAEIEAQTAITKYYELLKLYRLNSVHNYKSVFAQVVGEAPSNFQNTVEITVGTRDGVAVGMPVTDGAGLIGKVTKVYPDRSVVMLITDPQFSVQAQVLSIVSIQPTPWRRPPRAPPNTAISGRSLDPTTSTSTSTTTTTTPPIRRPPRRPPSPVRSTPASGTTTSTQFDDHLDASGPHRAARDRRHRGSGLGSSAVVQPHRRHRLDQRQSRRPVETAGGSREPGPAEHPDRHDHRRHPPTR